MIMRGRNAVLPIVAAVVAMCGCQTVRAWVVPAQGEWAVLSTGNGAVQYGDGGEFQVSVYSPSSYSYTAGSSVAPVVNPAGTTLLGTFYTFCASIQEEFYPGYLYQVQAPVVMTTSTMTAFGQSLFYDYATNNNATLPSNLTGYVPGHAALAGNGSIGGMSSVNIAGADRRRYLNIPSGTPAPLTPTLSPATNSMNSTPLRTASSAGTPPALRRFHSACRLMR